MRTDIVASAVFPDYGLTDHTGKHRKLSELQGPDPMILVLSRGGYCPKDRRQAEALVQLHREMEVGYSRLVTISTDNMILTDEYRTGVGAHWTFLSDPGRKVQKDLDIAEYTDPEHNPMIPHVIVLEPGLVIFKIYNGYWFFGRPDLSLASTSHVERLNGTTRLHMRRLTRLTYAFSKKRENFEAAVGLHFAYYNFVKRHITLRATPAMAAGIERDFWTVGNLVEAAA